MEMQRKRVHAASIFGTISSTSSETDEIILRDSLRCIAHTPTCSKAAQLAAQPVHLFAQVNMRLATRTAFMCFGYLTMACRRAGG
jgi:hypothetical protein